MSSFIKHTDLSVSNKARQRNSEISVELEEQQCRNFVTLKIPTDVKTKATVTPYILVDTVCVHISEKLQSPR